MVVAQGGGSAALPQEHKGHVDNGEKQAAVQSRGGPGGEREQGKPE